MCCVLGSISRLRGVRRLWLTDTEVMQGGLGPPERYPKLRLLEPARKPPQTLRLLKPPRETAVAGDATVRSSRDAAAAGPGPAG